MERPKVFIPWLWLETLMVVAHVKVGEDLLGFFFFKSK